MIYFIRDGASGLIKIGYTRSAETVRARMASYITECPGPIEVIRMHDGDRGMERDLHVIFRDHLYRGEWFRVTVEQIEAALATPGLGSLYLSAVEASASVDLSPCTISRMVADGRIPEAVTVRYNTLAKSEFGADRIQMRAYLPRTWVEAAAAEVLSKRVLPEDLVPQIVEAYQAGESMRDIGIRIGWSRPTVARALRREGIVMRARTPKRITTLGRGAGHADAKLTAEQVIEIRRRIAAGDRRCDIARDYGVQAGTIGAIKSGRNWSHTTVVAEVAVQMVPRFDAEKRAAVAEAYLSGLTINEVATKFGYWLDTIRRQLKLAGVPLRSRVESKMLRMQRVPRTRLTEDQVRAIRARVASGESRNSVARDIGISLGTVSQIAARKIWKHVA